MDETGAYYTEWSKSERKTLIHYAAAAKLLQLCPTLCDPIDSSPLGSPVPGILQARTLEWVAISFSSASKWKVKVKSLSRVWFFATPWTAASQAPPFMGFSRQEYWSGMPLPSPPIQYINAYIWNSERWQRWPYMRDSKRDRDVKNRLLDSVGEGEGGMIWEISIETCILSYVK